jgi:hypothetical protein
VFVSIKSGSSGIEIDKVFSSRVVVCPYLSTTILGTLIYIVSPKVEIAVSAAAPACAPFTGPASA